MDDDLTPLTRLEGKAGRRLADQVYERLLDDIVSGALPPGTPMAMMWMHVAPNCRRKAVMEVANPGPQYMLVLIAVNVRGE